MKGPSLGSFTKIKIFTGPNYSDNYIQGNTLERCQLTILGYTVQFTW